MNVKQAFVYGTLRQGGSNHHIVQDLIQSCAPASLAFHGSMYHYDPAERGALGRFPYLIENGSQRGDSDHDADDADDSTEQTQQPTTTATVIKGELMTFTDWDLALERLDELEGYPTFYYRKVMKVSCRQGRQEQAWVYLMQADQARQGKAIVSGDWIEEAK